MRPTIGSLRATAAAGTSAGLWRWDSPVPYLFGGLAAVMGLMAVALVVLSCSKCRPSSDGASPSPRCGSAVPGERPAAAPLEAEPRFVVVMAGDGAPRFLAKAVPALHGDRR